MGTSPLYVRLYFAWICSIAAVLPCSSPWCGMGRNNARREASVEAGGGGSLPSDLGSRS
ncbi:hypothetical protein PF011_g26242 [Phytophthora fragariae]|uniref:RxLR effector protein n=1 Tax=Phytophthora fragariae TaxID=53985 RepID=A0A6A3HNF1_9STRA|nr:hypothetical protein PF011_g26242 [Phytophthora fragariae]